jgi:MYXO-CTERM domain-containing protein
MNGNRADLTASGGPDLLATPGQFVIGTFLADSTTESFTFTSPSDANPIVNAIQLRDITTPEPSSVVALWGLGAMGVLLTARRRRRKSELFNC